MLLKSNEIKVDPFKTHVLLNDSLEKVLFRILLKSIGTTLGQLFERNFAALGHVFQGWAN